jgi:hypothetical protein
LQHFLAAFLCQERASNRTVKPRQQNDEMMSAEMLFYGNDHSQINMLFIFWSPGFYLEHPEARDSKFKEHAKPAVYYGPSRDTDSERYCLLWDGRRSFTVDIGCMRIDESQLIARAGLLTVLLGRDCVFFCVKFQYVRVFEHCRVRQAARRIGGGGSNPEPHAVFFQNSLNFVVKMLLQPPEMKFNKEKKR